MNTLGTSVQTICSVKFYFNENNRNGGLLTLLWNGTVFCSIKCPHFLPFCYIYVPTYVLAVVKYADGLAAIRDLEEDD